MIYNLAQVFVFPSLYEGFGFPVVEAMASGLPVITSNVSSFPEITQEAGILVNPYDYRDIAQGIERILNERDLKEKLREKGLKRASFFSWRKNAIQTVKVYKEVIKY